MKEKQLAFRDERPDDMELYLKDIRENRFPLSLLLDHVEDTRNLGAMFRLADAARLQHIWALGKPDLFDSKIIRRVSRSALAYVPHSTLNIQDAHTLARQQTLVALEITEHSIPYTEYEPQGPCILVIGNEKDGVSEELLALCQTSIHIPMYGVNTSMNVAMATAIAVYGLLARL
ncbi:MAG: hypothetical protein H6573_18645 [Lewinellaceae bacterium]|nr:hypothetical protein [Phaeodactylibacter sp.]MCB0616090.1 hypothetical protein [Phaeodactylibacter sp.]MCB9349510.1 hypothetical protein [Lewinellaceae bacterium]